MNESSETLKATVRAQRFFGRRGDHWDNYAVGQNVLHEELGYYDTAGVFYQLDEDTKDRLIAHSRQDIAHSLCNTASILRRIESIQFMTSILFMITPTLLGIILWRIW